MDCNVILFDGFETLDAFGPAEIFGVKQDLYRLRCYSPAGGTVTSAQNIPLVTLPLAEIQDHSILLMPGGMGTRQLVNDQGFIGELLRLAAKSRYVLTVCTGAALLAKTGLLDGRRATTNKLAFNWVVSQGAGVCWQKRARWVVDGKYYTSSGVSAGMDMALGFIADTAGETIAVETAKEIEYRWNSDKDDDPFAVT